MTRVTAFAIAALSATLFSTSCAGVGVIPQATATPAIPAGVTLWEEPADLASRDLFYGPWGQEHAPDPNGVYRLVERKHAGINLGLTVRDARGREWSVKQPFPGGLDPEGPVEVALSRLLTGIGYHQPPVYFLRAFRLQDDFGTRIEPGGRFRLKDKSMKETGNWKWEDNPFIGSRPYQGLIVLLMMFNSTDLKARNNSIYEHRNGDLIEQWYLPRDLGAALGDLNPVAPRKSHPAAFEQTPFILGVNGGHVQFAYSGWYKNLVRDRISTEDVVWASELLGRLSDQQFADAFRAGGYEPAVADRFIAKLHEKIEQGKTLNLRVATPAP